MHYTRLQRTGTTKPNTSLVSNFEQTCMVDGCDRPADTKGMCVSHYQKMRRWAQSIDMKPNDYVRTYRRFIKKMQTINTGSSRGKVDTPSHIRHEEAEAKKAARLEKKRQKEAA